MISPQYSEMNSFFWALSLRNMPQPATSEGAISKCLSEKKQTIVLCFKMKVVELTQSSLNADVLASDLGQIKLVRPAGLAQIRVAFPHRQIARALLCVTLGLAPAAREPILAVRTALAEFLAEVLRPDAGAHGVAWLAWMVAGREVVHMVAAGVLLQLDFPTVDRPQAMLLLLLARRCVVPRRLFSWNVSSFLLSEPINLQTW